MLRVLTLVYCICAVSATPIDDVPRSLSGRIIHGETIDIREAPHQVSIIRSATKGHTCGGSIVSRYLVLTAAHCTGLPASGYKIRSGSSFWRQDGKLHDVVEVIPHEKYGASEHGTPVNDIALMRVGQPFDIDETRQIVKLFGFREQVATGADAVVTGWGRTENGTLANQLQSLTISIVDRASCELAYEKMGGVPAGEICAQYSTGLKDMCSGDSGGPLMVGGRQVGIVSWSGPGCALPDYPGVYTEVASYRDWIDTHLRA